jgi:hypothetical protein
MEAEDPPSSPAPPATASRRVEIVVGGYVAAVIVAVAAPLAWIAYRDSAEETRRIQHDPHVRARVVDLREAEVAHDGEEEETPPMELWVEFTTRDGRLVRARRVGPMNGREALRLLGGEEVDVWYRPSNPEDALIRWEPVRAAR